MEMSEALGLHNGHGKARVIVTSEIGQRQVITLLVCRNKSHAHIQWNDIIGSAFFHFPPCPFPFLDPTLCHLMSFRNTKHANLHTNCDMNSYSIRKTNWCISKFLGIWKIKCELGHTFLQNVRSGFRTCLILACTIFRFSLKARFSARRKGSTAQRMCRVYERVRSGVTSFAFWKCLETLKSCSPRPMINTGRC